MKPRDSSPDWSNVLRQAGDDPLRILQSTRAVMASATDVAIDMNALREVANQVATREAAPEWDLALHYRATGPDADERTAVWIMILDALNFCFWGQGPDPTIRWRVEWQGELTDGYVALVSALRRGVTERQDLLRASWLAEVDREDLEHLLRPATGHPTIPLLDERVHHLRELGQGLLRIGGETPASTLIRSANGSAIALVEDIVRRFPSFNDVAPWSVASTGLPGNDVRFYKRAQILVSDLAGGLQESPLGNFDDLYQLTAFADYKVPQVLRDLGILRYSDTLSATIADRVHLPAGSTLEMEIRAATIWGCELLRQELAAQGHVVAAHELDWLLWEQGQSLPNAAPYHLTPTIYY